MPGAPQGPSGMTANVSRTTDDQNDHVVILSPLSRSRRLIAQTCLPQRKKDYTARSFVREETALGFRVEIR